MSELEYEQAIMPWIMEVEDVEAAWLNPSWWRGRGPRET